MNHKLFSCNNFDFSTTEIWHMWETGPEHFNSTDTRHGLYQGAYDRWPEVINVPFDFCSGGSD